MCLHRESERERDEVPEFALVLREWYQSCAFSGPLPGPEASTCVWCETSRSAPGGPGAVPELAEPSVACKCGSCCLVWHSKCAGRCVEIFAKGVGGFFSDAWVCFLCRASGPSSGPSSLTCNLG
eukprot:4693105-Pyramimonas_sp.AAC.1